MNAFSLAAALTAALVLTGCVRDPMPAEQNAAPTLTPRASTYYGLLALLRRSGSLWRSWAVALFSR